MNNVKRTMKKLAESIAVSLVNNPESWKLSRDPYHSGSLIIKHRTTKTKIELEYSIASGIRLFYGDRILKVPFRALMRLRRAAFNYYVKHRAERREIKLNKMLKELSNAT